MTCDFGILDESEWIDSKIDSLSKSIQKEGSNAQIQGYVNGTSDQGSSEYIEPLIGSNVLIKPSSQELYNDGVSVGTDGTYIKAIKPGTYDIRVVCLGYCDLELYDLQIDSSTVVQLYVQLGQGEGITRYKMLAYGEYKRLSLEDSKH